MSEVWRVCRGGETWMHTDNLKWPCQGLSSGVAKHVSVYVSLPPLGSSSVSHILQPVASLFALLVFLFMWGFFFFFFVSKLTGICEFCSTIAPSKDCIAFLSGWLSANVDSEASNRIPCLSVSLCRSIQPRRRRRRHWAQSGSPKNRRAALQTAGGLSRHPTLQNTRSGKLCCNPDKLCVLMKLETKDCGTKNNATSVKIVSQIWTYKVSRSFRGSMELTLHLYQEWITELVRFLIECVQKTNLTLSHRNSVKIFTNFRDYAKYISEHFRPHMHSWMPANYSPVCLTVALLMWLWNTIFSTFRKVFLISLPNLWFFAVITSPGAVLTGAGRHVWVKGPAPGACHRSGGRWRQLLCDREVGLIENLYLHLTGAVFESQMACLDAKAVGMLCAPSLNWAFTE